MILSVTWISATISPGGEDRNGYRIYTETDSEQRIPPGIICLPGHQAGIFHQ